MYLDIVFWEQIGYFVAAIIAGSVLGSALGLLVNRILDRTVERWLDTTQIGKELRKINLDFSDTVGLYTTIFVFLLFLIWGVERISITHPWWQTVEQLTNYALVVTLGFAFITVALLFVVLLSDYFGRLVRGYNKDVGDLLSVLLLVGLIAVVVKLAMGVMGLQYEIITDVVNGFVAFSIGWVISDFIIKNIEREYEGFRAFAPYGKYLILLIFLLVGLNAIFAKYLSTSIIQVLAWGVVVLFAAVSLPFIIKAIKEFY